MKKTKPKLIDISLISIVKFFLVLMVIVFLYFIKDILAILFVALLLSAAVGPAVNSLARRKIPKSLSVLVMFFLIIAFIAMVIILLIPPISQQLHQFTINLPEYADKVNQFFSSIEKFTWQFSQASGLQTATQAIQQSLQFGAGSVFDTIFSIFGGLISFLVVLVITFYLIVEEDAVRQTTKIIVPNKYQDFLADLIKKIQIKINAWLKGQFILSFIVGLLVYLGLLILGVDYALILALVAFVGEFIPYLGPVLAAIPALFVSFIASPILALFVLILFIIIQQAENHILVPKVMQRAVGLNPVISVIALLLGAKLAGLVGVILAIPVATAFGVLIKEIYLAKELSDQKLTVKKVK